MRMLATAAVLGLALAGPALAQNRTLELGFAGLMSIRTRPTCRRST